MNPHVEFIYNLWQNANRQPNIYSKEVAIRKMALYIEDNRNQFELNKLTSKEVRLMDQLGELVEEDIDTIKFLMLYN